jgi:hypothetical protein
VCGVYVQLLGILWRNTGFSCGCGSSILKPITKPLLNFMSEKTTQLFFSGCGFSRLWERRAGLFFQTQILTKESFCVPVFVRAFITVPTLIIIFSIL